MAYAGQQFQYEAMLMGERIESFLTYGCSYPAGIYCDTHINIGNHLPPEPSTIQYKQTFVDDEAWINNGSEVSFGSYQSSSSSSIHNFQHSCTDTSSKSEESSSSSSEDDQDLRRPKASFQYNTHTQKYSDPIESWAPPLQSCDELSTGKSVQVDPAHQQFIDPALLATAQHDNSSLHNHPKKRQRTQDELQTVQPGRNNDTGSQSTDSTRISLLDPQTLLQARSNEQQTILHKLQGFYAEFTSSPSPQDLQAIRALAALLDRLVRDWLQKPARVKCLIKLNNIPVSPAARNPEEPFACVCGCGYTSPHLGSLKRHLRQNWLASYWGCPLCEDHFGRKERLSAHLQSNKHLGSNEKVDETRDFYRNDFTKRCGFCGETCKDFDVFIKHIGKHFRGNPPDEHPKSMSDWKDNWDDDDSSNSNNGRGAQWTTGPKNNNDRHDRGGGSNGGTSGSSKGREDDSSKGSGNSRNRRSKQDNNRISRSSNYKSRATGFKDLEGSSSNDGSVSLSDTALPLNIGHIRDRRKAGRLPMRPKKIGKEPEKPAVAESMIDTVEASLPAAPNTAPAVSDLPRKGLQSSEVIMDAAERWKAFRLKYNSPSKQVQDAKCRDRSSLCPSLEVPRRLYTHEDSSRTADANVPGFTQSIETVDNSMLNRASIAEGLQAVSHSNATRHTKRRRRSRHTTRNGNANAQGSNSTYLAEADPFGTCKPFGNNGIGLVLSKRKTLFDAENSRNIMKAGTGGSRTRSEDIFDIFLKDFMVKYKKLDVEAQKYVSEHLHAIDTLPPAISGRSELRISQKLCAPRLPDQSQERATLLEPSCGTLEGSVVGRKQDQSQTVSSLGSQISSSANLTVTARHAPLQSVRYPLSKDYDKRSKDLLEPQTFDGSGVLSLKARPHQSEPFRSRLSTLDSHFATIDAGAYAECQKFMKQRPDTSGNGLRFPQGSNFSDEFELNRQYLSRRGISPDMWESRRLEFTRLYWNESRTLSEVRELMRERYGFQPTRTQYQKRLKAWDLRQNLCCKRLLVGVQDDRDVAFAAGDPFATLSGRTIFSRLSAVYWSRMVRSNKLKRQMSGEASSATTTNRRHRTDSADKSLTAIILQPAENDIAVWVSDANTHGQIETVLARLWIWRLVGKSKPHIMSSGIPDWIPAQGLELSLPRHLTQMALEQVKDYRSSSGTGIISMPQLKGRSREARIENFPFLKEGLTEVHARSLEQEPYNWGLLWNDTRNTPAWMTLWTVLAIGGAILLLQTTQLILQAFSMRALG